MLCSMHTYYSVVSGTTLPLNFLPVSLSCTPRRRRRCRCGCRHPSAWSRSATCTAITPRRGARSNWRGSQTTKATGRAATRSACRCGAGGLHGATLLVLSVWVLLQRAAAALGGQCVRAAACWAAPTPLHTKARPHVYTHNCQVGDILDRGDQELPILYFLERLQHQAAAAGGALHVLNGNHGALVLGSRRLLLLLLLWSVATPSCASQAAVCCHAGTCCTGAKQQHTATRYAHCREPGRWQ